MPRRSGVPKREVLVDPIYHSIIVTKLINQIMKNGEKSVAEGIVYGAFDIIKSKGLDPMDTFNKAMENSKPVLETKARRVGGATYQVPMEIRPDRRQTLAIRWLVNFSRARKSEKVMNEKLAAELMDAYNNTGSTVKKKEEMHKMAEANKAFAHYRW